LVCLLLIVGIIWGIGKLGSKEPSIPIEKQCKHQYVDGVCTECGEKDPDYVKPDEIVDISMVCGGDVMYHYSQIAGAYNYDGKYTAGSSEFTAESGTFNFEKDYQYIIQYVQSADIAFVNLETTFAGGPSYSGSPARFNCPDGLAATLKETGFDVVFTSNNHSLDRRLSGLKRTIQVLQDAGLETVGSRENTTDNRSIITEVKGVKLGVVSFTHETGTVDGKRTFNGSTMEDGAWDYLNTYRYNSDKLVTAEDKEKIKSEITWCKDNGADIVICYFHWDAFNEYAFNVDKLQKDLAQFAAESGADIIFGSHPHVVQGIDKITVNVDGKEKVVPVYYSLGNFISNQRYESFKSYGDPEDRCRAVEQELLACVNITYNKTKSELSINDVKAIPLWVDRFSNGKTYEYRIIPLLEGFENNEELKASGHVDRAKNALSNITSIIGAEYIYK